MSLGRDPIVISIADDFTGAAITAALLNKAGLGSIEVIGARDVEKATFVSQAIVINTEGRDKNQKDATIEISKVIKSINEKCRPEFKKIYWHKRIDSSLRGHINAELRVMLSLLNLNIALICPAYPSAGRITDNGLQKISGDILDPFYPKVNYALSSLIDGIPSWSTLQMSLEDVRYKQDFDFQKSGIAIIGDARDEQDLHHFASRTAHIWNKGALAVCSGPYLAHLIQLGLDAEIWNNKESNNNKPLALILVGSRSSVTQMQMAYLRKIRKDILFINPLLGKKSLPRMDTILAATNVVVYPWEDSPDTDMIIDSIAIVGSHIIQHLPKLTNLVISGGRTASRCLSYFGADSVAFSGEPFPLVAIGKIKGGICHNQTLITKGGLVGGEAQYNAILEYLSCTTNLLP